RSLDISTNNQRDGGMQAILNVNDSTNALLNTNFQAQAVSDAYVCVPGVALNITDPGKGVIANDLNVNGIELVTGPVTGGGSVSLSTNGTFRYTPPAASCAGTFTYCANNGLSLGACPANLTAIVTLTQSNTLGSKPTATPDVFNATVGPSTTTHSAYFKSG